MGMAQLFTLRVGQNKGSGERLATKSWVMCKVTAVEGILAALLGVGSGRHSRFVIRDS